MKCGKTVVPDDPLDLAARLWVKRDLALDEPGVTLDDVARLDRRLAETIDLLGWGEIRSALASEDPGRLFVASAIAFASGDAARVDAVLASGFRSAALFRGVESALGWVELAPSRALLEKFLASGSDGLRRVAIAAFAVQRVDPGPALDAAVRSADVPLRARAVKAVWQLGRRDLVPLVREAYADADLPARFSAAWAGALLARDPDAVARLRRFAETRERYPDRSVQLATLCMSAAEARAWHRRSLAPRFAVLGAWSLADPSDVPWLIERMRDDATARVAGEAVEYVTGLTLPTLRTVDRPDADPADIALPWPAVDSVTKLWERERERFTAGVRHVLGYPASVEVFRRVLRDGLTRHRHVAATEIAFHEGAMPYEVRAPGFRQIAELR